MSSPVASMKDSTELKKLADDAVDKARSAIKSLLDSDQTLHRAFLRLAFYDAILQNPIGKEDRPKGLIRHNKDLPENVRTIATAIDELDKHKTGEVSYADLYQLAGIEAIKKITGMDIKFQHGRLDACFPIPLNELGQFSHIEQGEDIEATKTTFHRLGFSDEEIVALFSAIIYWMNPSLFTLNQAKQVDFWSIYPKLIEEFKAKETPKSNGSSTITPKQQPTTGGQTPIETPKSQPSTVASGQSEVLNVLSNTNASNPTRNSWHWVGLVSDPSFRKHVELFSKDHEKFSMTYKVAHQKLSELGFQPKPPLVEIIEYHDMKTGIAFAVAMTIIFGFVGFFYETMRS